MKKTIIALALAGMTTSAYATKARVEALGQSGEDNYFIKDSRSIWYNASHIHDYADTMFVEWGRNGGSSTTTTAGTDGEGNPKAQGGFLKTHGDWVYGVHLGEESNTSILLRMTAESGGGASLDLLYPDNVVDVFVGRNQGNVKWGANLMYTSSETDVSNAPASGKEQSAMALRLGAQGENWEGHANISLKGETKTKAANPEEFDGKTAFHVGGAYNLGMGKVIANYKSAAWDIKNATQTTAVEGKYTQMWLGYGLEKSYGEGTVYTQVYYRNTKVELAYTGAPAELTHTILPLVVGFEAKATDWLTWRGSVSGNLMGNVKNKGLRAAVLDTNALGTVNAVFGTTTNTGTEEVKKTLGDQVAVNGGASLTFGKLVLDGMVGTTSNARQAASSSKKGVLALDNLITRVGMTYAF